MSRRSSPTQSKQDESFDAQLLARLRRQLLRWSAKRRRDLPWRRSRDAYRVWISEIMLQQTTVAAVIPYFERFVSRFPTLDALAAADEHDVLRLWEGLGYYSRARNLHAAVRQVVREYDGIVPSDVDTLTTLPGIGRRLWKPIRCGFTQDYLLFASRSTYPPRERPFGRSRSEPSHASRPALSTKR